MEGPSLVLAALQLQPFISQRIQKISGNTQIGKERLQDEKILDIFSWGKHLVFQFETFALRVHFLLYGTFEATVKQKKVTGDYPTKKTNPRLTMECKTGHIEMYNCSLRYLEEKNAKATYNYSIDVMSLHWDSKKAFQQMKSNAPREIADVLLDQTIFAGVGNIIKNETLFLMKIHPQKLVSECTDAQLKKLIKIVVAFCQKFLEWRQAFELKKHYQIYRKSQCPICLGKVERKKTGKSNRFSFICPRCQKL